MRRTILLAQFLLLCARNAARWPVVVAPLDNGNTTRKGSHEVIKLLYPTCVGCSYGTAVSCCRQGETTPAEAWSDVDAANADPLLNQSPRALQ